MTYRLTAALGLLVLAGCPVGSADDQETDAAGAGDGSSGSSGLTVTWDSTPAVPGPLTSDLRIDEIRLQASSLRLIGDSAAPGDPRTTRTPLDLRWNGNNAAGDIELGAAPPGLYSRIEIGTGGSDEHLVIKGEVRQQGNWRDFEIEDERSHAIVKNIVLALAPGEHKTIPVTVDVAVILAAVPFGDLESDDGVLELPDNHPAFDAIWAALDVSFGVPGGFIDGR